MTFGVKVKGQGSNKLVSMGARQGWSYIHIKKKKKLNKETNKEMNKEKGNGKRKQLHTPVLKH